MLITIERLLSPEEVKLYLAKLASAQWQAGRLSAGAVASKVKSNEQLDDRQPIAEELRNQILSRLGQHPQFISAALPKTIYPPKFNCYRNGGTYGVHVDGSVMGLPSSGHYMRTDLSATLFLTAPESYDGGVLTIETAFGVQEVKLEAGDMVLYPSSSLHQVTPVTRGERICAFFWIQSMVREPDQRTLLFDLDSSIQQLTLERGSDDAEVTRLSGIYHNLLRQWADC